MSPPRRIRSLSLMLSLCLLAHQSDAHEPVFARKGMVVAQEPLAADVGISILKSGGNAVDAAVAVGFALAVTHPFAGNIGGGRVHPIPTATGRETITHFSHKTPRHPPP